MHLRVSRLAGPVMAGFLAITGCASGGSGGAAPAGGPGSGMTAGATAGNPVVSTSVDSLRMLGPVYTPYDRSPRLATGDWLPRLLESRLVPVVEEGGLPPDTQALVWVLVTPEGRVTDAVLHTSSYKQAFDRAAVEVARELRYRPALRGGHPVPVWVLAEVSLLMR